MCSRKAILALAAILLGAGTAGADDIVATTMRKVEVARERDEDEEIVKLVTDALATVAREKKIRLNKEIAPLYLERSLAHSNLNRWKEAVADAREAVKLTPDSLDALNRAAWLTATSPDDKVRDGAFALRCASKMLNILQAKINDLKGDPNGGGFALWLAGPTIANCYDTAAAAHAEAKDFKKAVELQLEAFEILVPTGTQIKDIMNKQYKKKALQFERRLELYRNKQPYREKPQE